MTCHALSAPGTILCVLMDIFEDLLAPSRHALENNPFSNPFAEQPSSPDSWATPFDPHAFDITSQLHLTRLQYFWSKF